MKICNKKRVKQLLLALFIIALCPVISFAIISPTYDFYVNDYANVLSEDTENHILRAVTQLEAETSAQICVVTINSLDGADIFEYSLELFRGWGIGDEEKDNGVLILLSVEDREMWVTTGYGVEGTLTDVKLGQFRDEYAIPYYSNNDYDQGTRALFDAILNSLRVEEYGLEPYGDYEYNYTGETEISSEDTKGVLRLIAIPVVGFIILIIYQDLKYLRLKQYDKLHGTDRAIIYRLHCHEMRHSILQLLFIFFLRGGRGGGSGGGGNRGGGGSSGGGGAGGSF